MSVIEELIKDDVYTAVGRKKKVDLTNCWAAIPDSLKQKTGKNEYTAVSDFMMYIIAGKIDGLDEIKAFYDCPIQLRCPVMMGILLERWILLVLQDKAVKMHHFVMYTDSDTVEGKTSLRVNYTITYNNPEDLINSLNTYDHIIGIPQDQWNTGFDFLYMKFHDNKVIQMSFYQVTVAKSHTYNMKAMNAILDAFRGCGQFESFVVDIFFVNHSKGDKMRLGTVSYE